MINIRPHKLFKVVESKSCFARTISVVLPGLLHTPMLLETAILIALSKIVNAKTFFEFGTFVGVQTLNITHNLPESSNVYTLDLDNDSFNRIMKSQNQHDLKLSQMHFKHEAKLAFIDSPYEGKITRLYGDSNEFDFSDFKGKIDMVYIDGGHDLRTVRSDTENAFNMLPPPSMSCIAWHDYGNPNYPDNTNFLNKLSEELYIFHVEETMICFYLKNASTSLISELA